MSSKILTVTHFYSATMGEILQFSRIHREGLLLLPLKVGRLWNGHYLEIESAGRVLHFRVARRSRAVRITELAPDELGQAGFPSVDGGAFRSWWGSLPHGCQRHVMQVWVWTRAGMGVERERTITGRMEK